MNLKISLITAFTGCIAFNAGAQTITVPATSGKDYGFSVGLNTGVCRNTGYNKDDNAGKAGGVVGIGLYYRFNKHWELGFTTDYKLLSKRRTDYVGPWDASGTKHLGYYPVISHGVLVNYHFQAGKLDMYAGASAKLMVILGDNGRNNFEIWNKSVERSGCSPEVHFGANYPLSRHWSLNGQAGIERMLPFDRGSKTYITLPSATIGIRFHF